MKTLTKVEKSSKSKNDLLKDLKFLQEYVEEMKLALLYLNYDVEATRRERDHWRKRVEKSNG